VVTSVLEYHTASFSRVQMKANYSVSEDPNLYFLYNEAIKSQSR